MKHLRLIPLLILGLAAPALADSNGSATGGNAAGQSSLSGGLCQTSPAALSDGQQAGLEIDCTTHALKTSATITPSGQQAVSDTAGADSSGTFTNATQTTSVTATLETGTNAYSTVTVTVNGTYGTASATFEKSDDDALTNWYPVQCSQEGQSVIETGYSALTNTARMWQCNTQGANAFRVRSTAVASGTVAILISPSGMPTANGATTGVTQPTASNLNATVVGTGTFATQSAATQSGTWTVQPGNTANTTAWLVTQLTPTTAYEGNVTNTKVAANAAATKLRAYMITNNNSLVCYLQFFNLASASVTVGTTPPIFFVGVPALGGANMILAFNFSTAMTIAATTTATGSTNCTSGLDASLIQD